MNPEQSSAHVIPGHGTLVLERYSAPAGHMQGVVARLDCCCLTPL